ncbi:MAG: acetyl-CoA C-acyltransferase [Bacteroidetes bacterium]|nr:acetyl-CoA C-acyltransferase [Bacteroidota bacterium]
MANAAYIYDGIRTPIGNFGGALAHVRTDDLAAHVLRQLLLRNPALDPAQIGDVIMGCANQAGEDNRNVARMALLLAGLPYSVPGETVNRLCASGMSAVVQAKRAIESGDARWILAGGVEGMSRGPYVISKSAKPFGTDAQMYDSSFGWRFVNPKMQAEYGIDPMGMTAENLVELYGISREDQDAFAWWSQQKASAAQQAGILAEEIAPIELNLGKAGIQIVSNDEFIKPNTSLEGLAKLKPAFKKDGSVTAGNASGLNDGAAALLIGSENAAFQPLARIVSSAVVGVEPRIMGIGPVEASRQALSKAGLSLHDMEIIELNEAFAAQVLACTRQLGLEDQDPRINMHGGAIALGHPLGMSGARLVLSAARSLQRMQKRYALCSMCIGVGQGYAVILEKV